MNEAEISRGFASTWLIEHQEHEVGRKAFFDPWHGDLHRGEEWTDDGRAGFLASSPFQILPPGEYTALLQLWSERPGQRAGRLAVEDDGGRLLAELPVTTGPADAGDWQRSLLGFSLVNPARVRVRFHHDGIVPLWTGAMHLTRGGRRPIYVIGHNRNTLAQFDRSLDLGANAVEVDLSYRGGRIMAAEVPPLPGWTEIAEADAWLRHAQGCAGRWAFLYLDCKLHQVPDGNFYRYGQAIAQLLRDARVDPRKCMFNVPDKSGIDLHQAVKDTGFSSSSFSIDGVDNNQPILAAPTDWAEAAARYGLQVIGMGRAAIELDKPLALWWRAVQATVAARDAGQSFPKKIVFWSLHEKAGMRKLLDLGVDGIIADREDHLCQVLEEEPYRQFCRRAGPAEWDPGVAFGLPAQGGCRAFLRG